MPKAPRPGVGKRQAQIATAQRICTIAFRDQTHRLAIYNVPIRERLLFLKEVGFSFEALTFRDEIYTESIAPLVWLARRAAGERTLTFDQSLADWPSDLTTAEVSITISDVDPEADDPEP